MSCSVCGNSNNNSKYVVTEMMLGFRDIFEYFQCSKCGCLQIASIPTDLTKYYQSNYYSFKTPNSTSKLRWFLAGKHASLVLTGNRLVSSAIRWLMPSRCKGYQAKGLLDLKLTKETRILDVGCGGGDLVYLLAEAGFKNPLGIDAYIESDVAFSNGAIVSKATMQNIHGEYDLIMFNDSFEHIPNQLETLQCVNRLLAKNGVCLLNMPTVSSYAWTHYKEKWVQLDAPRHLCIHSQNSIKILAQKAGFEVNKIVYNSSAFQFWGSIQYQKGIPLCSEQSYYVNPSKSLFSKNEILAFERRAKEMNLSGQGDAAVFHLKKIIND